jgi:ABC-2 type transport system ATP-binding protein
MSIEIKNLTKQYGIQKAVHDISFTALKGEIVGFLGPNGAGKSTTMKIATAFLPPSSGEVKICGYDVEKQSVEVRKRIGYLPEHNPLYLDAYIHEYLRFIGGLHGLRGVKLKNAVNQVVEKVGLIPEQNKKIGQLSKGYRQRVGLAQALLHDPEVLILDEPTTGLDPNQILEIRQVIRDVSPNKAVIFSTHIMQEVQALCSRVIIISKGKLVADGSLEVLKSTQNQYFNIEVEFDSLPNEWQLYKNLEHVLDCEVSQNSANTLIIKSTSDIRAEIFKFSASRGYVVVGLNKKTGTLEKVFRELTA